MESLLPVATFAFVASITPGPNNAMLSASGVAFGLRRTLPHVLGVSVGFTALLVLCASGIGALVIEFPTVALGLKVVGSIYLLYLAWVMRNALDPSAAGARRAANAFSRGRAVSVREPERLDDGRHRGVRLRSGHGAALARGRDRLRPVRADQSAVHLDVGGARRHRTPVARARPVAQCLQRRHRRADGLLGRRDVALIGAE